MNPFSQHDELSGDAKIILESTPPPPNVKKALDLVNEFSSSELQTFILNWYRKVKSEKGNSSDQNTLAISLGKLHLAWINREVD